jgi:hypothetical protein
MPSVNGFQLIDTDIDILRYAYSYRFLQIDHLIALTERPHKRLHRRLLKLIEHKYLARIVLPNEKHIYVLGAAGVHALVEQGIAPKELIDFRLRHLELKPLFLKHTLMVVDVHVALELASRASKVKLVAWKQGQELFDTVRVTENGEDQRLPVRPDGFFTLEDTSAPAGQKRVHFFLEADRSTTTHKRFEEKLRAYWHYFNAGTHQKKYGIKSFRVATLTLTDARAFSLCEAAANTLPQQAKKFYLFSSVRRFSLQNAQSILKEIFITPRELNERRYPLVQPLTA